MRNIKITFIAIFFLLLSLPVAAFNWKENTISEIDNRMLVNSPFNEDILKKDVTRAIEAYVQDRIGYRDEMIYAYTVLNDRMFHKMVHPAYEYGKHGYVFAKAARNKKFGDYEVGFADMVQKIQNYCTERGVPFIFVLNPDKRSILSSELKDGVNYNNDWVREFKEELDKRDVNYVDNSVLMKEKTMEGELVFNKIYNAGHWNDLGAFYGVNHILQNLQSSLPKLHINQKEDFDITERLNTSLMVSEFPIHEYEAVFEPKCSIEDITDKYVEEIKIHPQHREFHYYINPEARSNGAPKALVFQGSYMNGMGYKFLMNSLGEYIIVHDYQNVIDFDYYFNIFKPECVIFEAAEYTFNNYYFDLESMNRMDPNPALDLSSISGVQDKELTDGMLNIQYGEQLAVITVRGLPADTRYAYVVLGSDVVDLKKTEEGYSATVEKEQVDGAVMVVGMMEGGRDVKYSATQRQP